MKKSQFSEEQMVKILREADRSPVARSRRSTASATRRSTPGASASGSSRPADVKRLRQLEHENAKLKKLVAERDLEIDVMREVAAKKW